MDHFLLMVWLSVLVSTFFSFLWRTAGRERLRLFLKMFVIMVAGSLALGWLMFPFP